MSLPSHCISYFDIVILELVIHITENIQLKRGVMTRTWQSSWSVMRWIACMYLSSPQWKKKYLHRKSLCFIYDAIWGGFGAKEGPAIESCPVRLKVRIIWTAATPQPWQLSKYTHTHSCSIWASCMLILHKKPLLVQWYWSWLLAIQCAALQHSFLHS